MGSRCRVPRIAQVFMRVTPSSGAGGVPPRRVIPSAAEEATWAWTPASLRATVTASDPTGSARNCRLIRHASTWGQVTEGTSDPSHRLGGSDRAEPVALAQLGHRAGQVV